MTARSAQFHCPCMVIARGPRSRIQVGRVIGDSLDFCPDRSGDQGHIADRQPANIHQRTARHRSVARSTAPHDMEVASSNHRANGSSCHSRSDTSTLRSRHNPVQAALACCGIREALVADRFECQKRFVQILALVRLQPSPTSRTSMQS